MAPILFQEYVEKETEIRVTVIGGSVFAAEIDSQSSLEGKDDWRKAGPGSLKTNPVQLPKSLSDKCLQIVKELGLNFGTIDLIKTPNGCYVFLELNPNGQWGWLEEATGESYTDALVQNLDAARSV